MRKLVIVAAAMTVSLFTMCKKDDDSIVTYPVAYTIQNKLNSDVTLSVFKVGYIQKQFTVNADDEYKYDTGYMYADDIVSCDSVFVSSGSSEATYYSSSVRTGESLRRLDYVLTQVDAWEGFAYQWKIDDSTF